MATYRELKCGLRSVHLAVQVPRLQICVVCVCVLFEEELSQAMNSEM